MADDDRQFATGFRLHLPDGTVLDGAELPSGRVITDHPADGFRTVALTLADLLKDMPTGTRVERPGDRAP